ncbi:MAG: helix-hairpin-helix domain-containing protein [Cyanobacteria bacterium]|nr:helix-hairpin-helix domain-containing protein [Cyanobacteriota bacterium]
MFHPTLLTKYRRFFGPATPVKISLILYLGLISLLYTTSPVSASPKPYISPEIRYADQLRQRVQIPERLSINASTLNELMTLPGIDESTALKMMRSRPFKSVQDLYNLPLMEPREVRRLIEAIQPKIAF